MLSYGVEDATVCCFDKRGTYLAVGYATGIVVIWDFVTRGIGRVIEAHARAITALSWARGGRRLLSASHDQRLHYWALEPSRPELIRVICLDSPVFSAMNTAKALCFAGQQNVSPPSSGPSASPSPAKKPRPAPSSEQSSAGSGAASGLPAVLCLALDRRASRVCLGTAAGQVVAVGAGDGEVSNSINVVGCSKVKQLDFSRDGKWMLVNGGEKVIRMLEREGNTGRSVRDFQDVVNRTRWQCCRFTGDSEYIAGGSRAEGACIIYIWTIEGHLVTRLEGPNLGLLSLARHPVRPFLAAALTNGKVQLWGTTHTANWTAFAADFEELEENVVYVEKEDEFDVVVDSQDPEGHKRKAEKEQQEEEAIVSIEAIDTVGAWNSDSEGEGPRQVFYLSTEPGAAAREGWYDLEVQTAKTGFSSAPGDGHWEDREEWATVRVSGEDGAPDENDDDWPGGKKPPKKKKSSTREFGKRSKSHTSRSHGEKNRSRAEEAGGGGGGSVDDVGGGGGGEAAVATLAEGGGDGGGGNGNEERPAAAEEPSDATGAAAVSSAPREDNCDTDRPDTNGAQAPSSSCRQPGDEGERVGDSGELPNPDPADRVPASTTQAASENGDAELEPSRQGPAKRRREEGE
eukprot:g16476.t2